MSAPSSDTAAIRQTIRALRKAGYSPSSVNDGEESVPVVGMGENALIDALTGTGQAWLYVGDSWVFFVLGNDPEEVVNDYTTDLEPVIGPLFDRWGI